MNKENNSIGNKIGESFVNLCLSFFIIVTGIMLLPKVPPTLHFLYALSIMGSSVWYTIELLMIWFGELT